ncbi:MAG: type II secretion system protein [Candidatus Brocadiaceae bacterium]|nr:type II secretion system protein [Candidatus Brocadiaceae bacterium]
MGSKCSLQDLRVGTVESKLTIINNKQSCESAFTLLELIIAISIGTVLILLVSFSVRMGFFQMERGSKQLEEQYRDNNALFFFRQQVTSMRSETIDKDVIFEGDSERIVFVTPISLEKSYGLGLMMVSYYVENGSEGVMLGYKEKKFVPVKNFNTFKDQNVSMFDDSESVEIVKGYKGISFQFLGLEGGDEAEAGTSGPEWKDKWIVNSLPKAIKIVFTKDGQSKELMAPVMVMY